MEKYASKRDVFNGPSEKGKWSKGVFVSSEIPEKGDIGLVISVIGDESFQVANVGSILLGHIQDDFLSSGEEILTGMEESLAYAGEELKTILERETKELSQKGVELDVAFIVLLEEYAFYATFGNGFILLYRGNKLINVSDGLKSRYEKEVKVGSGTFEDSDTFVLATPLSTQQIDESNVLQSIESFSFNNLDPKSTEYAGCSVLLIKREEEVLSSEEDLLTAQEEDDLNAVEEESSKENTHPSRADEIDEEEFKPEKTEIIPSGGSTIEKSKAYLQNARNKFNSFLENSKNPESSQQQFLKRTKIVSSQIFVWLKKTVWEDLLGFHADSVYLRGAKRKQNWKGIVGIIVILVIVVFLFISSIRGIARQREEQEQTEQVTSLLTDIDDSLSTAQQALDEGNRSNANESLQKADSLISQAQSANVLVDDINERKQRLEELGNKLNKVIILPESSVIADLGSFIENASPSDIAFAQDQLYVVDSEKSSLYRISIDGQSVNVLYGAEQGLIHPSSITPDSAGNLAIFDQEAGIISVNVKDNTIGPISGLSPATVGEVIGLEAFSPFDGSEYLYYLVPSRTMISRSSIANGVYGFPALRYENDAFANAKDLEIDENFGKLYVLVNERQGIIRYVGDVDNYQISGLPDDAQGNQVSLAGSDAISVSLDYLLIASTQNNTIMAVTKGTDDNPSLGIFKGQFKVPGGLHRVVDMVVDPESNTLYMLDDSRLIRIDLSLLNTIQ